MLLSKQRIYIIYFETHCQMLSKIAPGHMRTCSISFHCARTKSKSAEIMLHKPSNAKLMEKKQLNMAANIVVLR